MKPTQLLALLLCASIWPATAQVTTRDLGGHYGPQQGVAVPVPVPVPVPDVLNRNAPLSEPITTSGNSCTCQVAETSGGACMIFLRTNAADWIARNAPQTALRSSASGRYYDAPFALAASACAGRKVAPGGVKVHWLDRRNAILEWK
ncbi:hypothetical protein RB25_14095 [Herbaspirillum rubrisubalbicans]|uniref:Uncharacterized protein n=2 Tax=Herbaspirillum rubrisubalbicans TaxID=80842 RepID=A0ABX9C8J4_9BURK|nr:MULTISPECIES: hypothetical protein [Herbaspirillum]QJQ01397.1 hypothetical protein C798_14470 [Herbaspirillum rubrisubalbicans Os34]RAM66875.1 hypothetical protein RB24_00790 [Herbaspirillum rubrisubalbicans]RAN47535.1 hypothetical protein RB25_14095 [Herbaspirillum rubrisubalbicans]